jgi:hypothetical protein
VLGVGGPSRQAALRCEKIAVYIERYISLSAKTGLFALDNRPSRCITPWVRRDFFALFKLAPTLGRPRARGDVALG